jgi:hypothetical protein
MMQLLVDQIPDIAEADNQRITVAKVAVEILRQLRRHRCDRHRAPRDVGLGADPLGHTVGGLEDRIELRPDHATLGGDPVRRPDLAQHLRLADHLAVE